jgi:hypothetical protein
MAQITFENWRMDDSLRNWVKMKCDITVTVCSLQKLDVAPFIALPLGCILVGHMK